MLNLSFDFNEQIKPNCMAEKEELKKSKREDYLARMKSRKPDVNYDDDESRYGAYMEHDDEMQGQIDNYKKSDDQMKGAFSKDPRLASFISGVLEGGDTPTGFVKNFGKDILDSMDDEEVLQKITEANNEYLGRVESSKKLEQERRDNLEASVAAVTAFKEEKGLSDEEFGGFVDKFNDLLEEGFMGKLSPEFLEVMYKGLNYEEDIASAAEIGRIDGKNEKIETENRTKQKSDVPSMRGVGSGSTVAPKTKKKGSFYEGPKEYL